ncbi:GTPase domain-containing protein [Streptomyces sp. SID13031]|uniref:TRAFAC clade GTPase domain-containing protein n=1 Tax=Streptomyces sp. SID13031 TaxID=2706046 RepID=UPI0013CD9CAE|nr:GTPase domain-containing protein [Streptomyces sp. SID13031]NEA30708.1 GTPase domain-containing protein [Streptomyces sp. SID13031]
MKILMLGVSNAGKTSYVSSMYGAMSRGHGPFTLRAERPADHLWLLNNAARIQQGVYPLASDRRSSYNLQLWHSGQRFFDFVWRDYRGGALTELSTTSPQAKQLRADLATADGLVVMIDSTELGNGLRSRSKVRPVVATTLRLLMDRTAPMPLVVALTKWDLVRTREQETAAAADDVLGDLVRGVGAESHLHGAVVPVACGQSPLNVTLPVLWCLHIGIVAIGNELVAEVERNAELVQLAERKRGVLDRMTSIITGEPSWDQIHRENVQQYRSGMALLQPLIEPSKQLGSLFEDVYLF